MNTNALCLGMDGHWPVTGKFNGTAAANRPIFRWQRTTNLVKAHAADGPGVIYYHECEMRKWSLSLIRFTFPSSIQFAACVGEKQIGLGPVSISPLPVAFRCLCPRKWMSNWWRGSLRVISGYNFNGIARVGGTGSENLFQCMRLVESLKCCFAENPLEFLLQLLF